MKAWEEVVFLQLGEEVVFFCTLGSMGKGNAKNKGNAKRRASIESKLGRKLSDKEFAPFKHQKCKAMAGKRRDAAYEHRMRCDNIMNQSIISEDDIVVALQDNEKTNAA